MSLQFPPSLRVGDCVAIVSPSGKISNQWVQGASWLLRSWGLQPLSMPHVLAEHGRYAGTVDQRLVDLQAALDNPQIKGILCSRGGYGVVHLLNRLDFAGFRQSPKWVMGFSDITALHNRIQYEGFASLHTPMARHLTEEGPDDRSTLYLKDLLFGHKPRYVWEPHALNRCGRVKGILRGGNLAVGYGLRATPYDWPMDNTVLFLEDVGERPHAVERMLYNLKLSGAFDRLKGLIIGRFTEYDDPDMALGKPLYEAIADVVAGYDFPVCYGFPVGHVKDNWPLIVGSEVGFSVSPTEVVLDFNSINLPR